MTRHRDAGAPRCETPDWEMPESERPASIDDRREQRDASAAPLRAIAEAVQDAIIGADRDGLVTKWLAGAERLFGWRRAEMLGRPLSTIVPEELRARYLEAFESAVA